MTMHTKYASLLFRDQRAAGGGAMTPPPPTGGSNCNNLRENGGKIAMAQATLLNPQGTTFLDGLHLVGSLASQLQQLTLNIRMELKNEQRVRMLSSNLCAIVLLHVDSKGYQQDGQARSNCEKYNCPQFAKIATLRKIAKIADLNPPPPAPKHNRHNAPSFRGPLGEIASSSKV